MESGGDKLVDWVFIVVVMLVLAAEYVAVRLHLLDPTVAIGATLVVLVLLVAGYLYATGYDFRKLLT